MFSISVASHLYLSVLRKLSLLLTWVIKILMVKICLSFIMLYISSQVTGDSNITTLRIKMFIYKLIVCVTCVIDMLEQVKWVDLTMNHLSRGLQSSDLQIRCSVHCPSWWLWKGLGKNQHVFPYRLHSHCNHTRCWYHFCGIHNRSSKHLQILNQLIVLVIFLLMIITDGISYKLLVQSIFLWLWVYDIRSDDLEIPRSLALLINLYFAV